MTDDDIFETVSLGLPSAEPTKVAALLPEPSKGFGAIVERVFSLKEPEKLEDELMRALERADILTPGVLRQELADAPRLYREAHRLYVAVYAELETLKARYTVVEGAMREAARRELEVEKRTVLSDKKALRTKQITDADVMGRVAEMYPDESAEVTRRKVMLEKTVEHLKHLVDVFKRRCSALEALHGARGLG